MPAPRCQPPKFQRYHGRFARCKVFGKEIHLGLYDAPEAREAYQQILADWANAMAGKKPKPAKPVGPITVDNCVAMFGLHIRNLFKAKSGRQTGTRANYLPTLKLLVEFYGATPAEEFGPLKLIALRKTLIDRGLARKTINDHIARIKRVFKFAASREMVSESVPLKLIQLEGLRAGESKAAEPAPIRPVDDAIVEATLPHLPVIVADMVRLQRLTGARPGEIVQIRPRDVDRSSEIWFYTPREHKTEAHGITRVICIGPKAQAILLPYLLRPADEPCFSPREVWKGRSWSEGRRREPRAAYTSDTYRRAIVRGCEKAFSMPVALRRAPTATGKRKAKETSEAKLARQAAAEAWRAKHCWHPHQLRHTAATEIRKTFGLESAQVTLGHTKANMTERYAEKNLQLAEEVARRIG